MIEAGVLMAPPGVIDSYLAELARRLPASITDELADGVEQTCARFPFRRADRGAARPGRAAGVRRCRHVAASPAKRTSRLLLAAGLPPALLALAACVSGCRIIATLHSLPAMMSAAV